MPLGTITDTAFTGERKLRVLSLFAGIGGFDLGLERTGGFETVAFCEIEQFPQSVLAEHWCGVPIYHDVRDLTSDRLAADGIAVDVICGGFPCQDLSTSGSGLGLDGERSGLWWEFFRLIREIRPGFVIVENSPELLDQWLGDILGALASIRYDAEWECIPAAAVGAPHERDRIWLVAYPDGFGQSQPRGLLHAVHTTPGSFGEADALVASVQGSSLPFVCRRHDGVPARLAKDQLRALGNAVVPQIPELIGNAILASIHDFTGKARPLQAGERGQTVPFGLAPSSHQSREDRACGLGASSVSLLHDNLNNLGSQPDHG